MAKSNVTVLSIAALLLCSTALSATEDEWKKTPTPEGDWYGSGNCLVLDRKDGEGIEFLAVDPEWRDPREKSNLRPLGLRVMVIVEWIRGEFTIARFAEALYEDAPRALGYIPGDIFGEQCREIAKRKLPRGVRLWIHAHFRNPYGLLDAQENVAEMK